MDYASFVFRHFGEKPVCVVSTDHLVESVFGDVLQAAKNVLAAQGDEPRAIAQFADGRQVAVGSAFCALLTNGADKVAHAVLGESQSVTEASYKVHRRVGDMEIVTSGRGRELYVRKTGEGEPAYMVEFDTTGDKLTHEVFRWSRGDWQPADKVPGGPAMERALKTAYYELHGPDLAFPRNESSDDKTEIAQTILQQLGGKMFMVMTGAKVFGVDGDDSRVNLKLKIGRGARNGISVVVITYNRGADDYSMSFQTRAGRVVKEYDGIYGDNLASLFKEETGFDTSLGSMRRRMESIDEATQLPKSPLKGKPWDQVTAMGKDGYTVSIWRGQKTKWHYSLTNPQGGGSGGPAEGTKVMDVIFRALNIINPPKRAWIVVGPRDPKGGDPRQVETAFWFDLALRKPVESQSSVQEVALKDVTKTVRLPQRVSSAQKFGAKSGTASITPAVYDWAVDTFVKSEVSSVTNESTAVEKQLITILNMYGAALGTETVQVSPFGDYIRVSTRLQSPIATKPAEIKYFAMPTNENLSDQSVYDYLFEMKMGKGDREVIDAFTDQKAADSKKFTTDGKQLDGNWMGGRNIARWENDLIVFRGPDSKSAQAVQRLIRKMAPKMSLHPDERRESLGESRYPSEKMYSMIRTVDEETAAKLDKLVRGASGMREVQDAMEDANDLIQGHGVEGIMGTNDRGLQTAVLLYVNMGDTYDGTLCYDVPKKQFFVGDWGSWVEKYGDKYQVESLDEAAPTDIGPNSFDPRRAMIYFALHFEEYNYEEDRDSDDPDAQKRAADFLKMGNRGKDQFARAIMAAEDAAISEITRLIKKAKPNVRINNEGHGQGGELIMKFGVDSMEDAKAIALLVSRNTGGGDDIIYLNAPYMEARDFRLYPQGVNKRSFALTDIDEIDEGWNQPVQWTGKKNYRTVHVVWSPVNSAWITMFGDSPTGIGDSQKSIWTSLDDLKYELKTLGLKLGKKVGNGYEITNAD